MPRYVETGLNECTDPTAGDWMQITDVSATGDQERKLNVSRLVLLDTSGRMGTTHIYRALGGGVWPLKIEGVVTGQPAIEFVDGAGTPNRWLVGSGKGSVADGVFFIYDIRQAAHRFAVSTAGVVMVNNLAGTGNRAVYSDATGNLTNTASDARLKTSIESITPAEALTIANALQPVRYNWRDQDARGEGREMGLIAQDVQAVAPEVVGENSDGMLSLDYAKLVSVLAGAVQALTARVQALEAGRANP